MTDRFVRRLGWVATAGSLAMYFSYIDQIQRNLAGEKGSLIQPLATTVATTLWLLYGFWKSPRDWPIVLANAPGVVLGLATVVTAIGP